MGGGGGGGGEQNDKHQHLKGVSTKCNNAHNLVNDG